MGYGFRGWGFGIGGFGLLEIASVGIRVWGGRDCGFRVWGSGVLAFIGFGI